MAKTLQLGERNYQSLYNVLQTYRRAGGHSDTTGNKFNNFDNPATVYFRIFFDFQHGLLDCIEDYDLGKTYYQPPTEAFWDRGAVIRNSALNYLTINNEWERADMLREFINLLSNINTNSPWYFSSLEGLGELLNRPEYTGEAFTLPEVKTLSIKCLPDAYDTRIGTLLDLYKAMCYSQQLHKEIIPANLRRFNMYVYIFSTNIRGIHTLHEYVDNSNIESKEPAEGWYATYDHDNLKVNKVTGDVVLDTSEYLTSSKLILLKDCEIDLNANKSGYEEVNNAEGFQQSYTIPIMVRVVEEQRYNEFLMKRIGDYVVHDADLPGSNEEGAGILRETIWDSEEADRRARVKDIDGAALDERMEYSLKTGMVDPKYGSVDYSEERNQRFKSTKSLGEKIYTDQNKASANDPFTSGSMRDGSGSSDNNPVSGSMNTQKSNSILEPWASMAEQKAEQLAGQANQIIKSATSTVSSWTNLGKLSKNLAGSVDSLVNQLMFGNMFETNLQTIASGISSAISGASSGAILNGAAHGGGWSHSSRSNSSDQLGHNLSEYSTIVR